jgi:hypothetical protein
MKLNTAIVSIIIVIVVFSVIGALAAYNIIPFQQLQTEDIAPRRYMDSSSWVSFNEIKKFDFDFIITRTLYILFMLQSAALIQKFEKKNIFLIILFMLCTLIVLYGLLTAKNVSEYFVSGLNPFLGSAFYIISTIQILISVYLNLTALKRLKNTTE